jgi:hypothetical protein
MICYTLKLSVQMILQSHFNQACSEVCSSLQPLQLPPRLRRLRRLLHLLLLLLMQQIVLVRCLLCDEAIKFEAPQSCVSCVP